jgi:lysylphosphatidylglycerol synthetase-like protein (DUF2156 family)
MAIRDLRTAADPLLRALLIFTALAVGLLSLEGWARHHQSLAWAAGVLLGLPAPARLSIALAVAAAALYLATRPKRGFRRILVVLAVAVAWLSLGSGRPGLVAVALVDAIAALLASSLWTEESDPVSSRLGWSLLGVALLLAALSAWLLLYAHHARHPAPVFVIPLSLAFVAAVGGLALLDRNPALPARRDPGVARQLYRLRARSGVAPFALMRDKSHFWAPGGEAFLAFGCRTGVALSLGPPIGPDGPARELGAEFRQVCRRRGWRPAWYQVGEADAALLPGTLRLPLGREALVNVDRFSLEGRPMANLRHQVTKACRLGVSVEVRDAAEVQPADRSATRALADLLAERSPLGEMTFSVGRRDDPADVERTVALAHGETGDLAGYVTWLWLPAACAVVLDEVKRAPAAPAGTVELLIERSLAAFRGRARVASLGLAPIAGRGTALAARALRDLLGVRSASPGLVAFKAKFRPGWEPRYLVVERMVDVPAVLLAVLLLHYPELLTRSRVRAAFPRAAS